MADPTARVPPIAGAHRQLSEEKEDPVTRVAPSNPRVAPIGSTATPSPGEVTDAERLERIALAAADDITLGDIRARTEVAKRVLQAIYESKGVMPSERPERVQWLCSVCHGKEHRRV